MNDPQRRYKIDCVVSDARTLLIKQLNLPVGVHDDHPTIKDMNPPFKVQVKMKMKDILIEDELRRRRLVYYIIYLTFSHYDFSILLFVRALKTQLANEGAEARKKDEEIEQKKRKIDEAKQWEG